MNNASPAPTGAPIPLMERRLELSGCAAVEGGILLVEDELIGAVLFADDITSAPVNVATIKLERRKKARAPFAPAHKLFPYQDFEDIATGPDGAVYLIGSHHGKDGERRPDREFLFRAEWDAKDLELKVTDERYNLLDAIAPALRDHNVDIGLTETEIDDRLNIEGLAVNGDTIYIGLRAPTTAAGEALLLRGRLDEVMAGQGALVAVPLPLGGGIRALEWDPVRNTLLALSGPVGDLPGDSALWAIQPDTGKADSLLRFEPGVARKGPEGLCRLPGGPLVVALDGEGNAHGGELILLEE